MSDHESCPCNVKTHGPFCGVEGGEWWICTLPPGHSGEHIACRLGEHRIHVWPKESESAPETVTIPRADLERVREALEDAKGALLKSYDVQDYPGTLDCSQGVAAIQCGDALALPMFRKEKE